MALLAICTPRVLVVGAGPSGLSAAYHLARLGHAVEIRDAGSQPGGMLHFGIPAYRLPREVLMQEVRRIEAMGVKIVLGHKVEAPEGLAETLARDPGIVGRRPVKLLPGKPAPREENIPPITTK